jgi:hypothetical protein
MGTIVVEKYWRNLERLSLRQSRLTDFEKIDQASGIYLDITTEGILLRELRDIMDELHIMMEIYLQQLRVAKDFSKSLHTLCGQESFSDPGDILQELRRVLGSLNDRQVGAPTNGDIHAITSLDTQGIMKQERSIPNSTLKKAKNLLEQIEGRLSELRSLEDKTKEIIDQVRYSRIARERHY